MDLWQTFTAKAEAVGASVDRAPDEQTVRSLAIGEGVVVAQGLCAVAETGSVLLSLDNATRGAAMLAEHLLLLVPEERIVPTLDRALEEVATLVRERAPYVTLMTGPSRTADIERTLTIGVHGPRELTIVILGEEP